MNRSCPDLICQTLEKIPPEKTEFIKELNEMYEKIIHSDVQFHWMKTVVILEKHIPVPKEEWEFEIVSLWTTKDIKELKKKFK